MNNFILEKYIPDVSVCDSLIEYFKSREDKNVGMTAGTVNTIIKRSTDIGIGEKEFKEREEVKNYLDQLQTVVEAYVEKYPYCDKNNPWGIIEPFNIQYYKPTEGYTAYHTERGTNVKPYCDRHLVFMTYLNDVDDQGETHFIHQDIKYVPRKGLTLIWPADWTHTHCGIPSPTQEKYIITGWFTYLDATNE
jgi:hypothetical protein